MNNSPLQNANLLHCEKNKIFTEAYLRLVYCHIMQVGTTNHRPPILSFFEVLVCLSLWKKKAKQTPQIE
jgi:hypothetical protein